MLRIMLLNPVIREWSNPNVPPLGLMYLSSVLRALGHYVEIFDINGKRPSKKEIEDYIANSKFDIYGTGGIVTTYAHCDWLSKIINS